MLQFSVNYTYNIKYKREFRLDVYTGSWDKLDLNHAKQSYGIILNNEGKLVITYNNETKNWLLPGGSIEENESPVQALIREVYEESAVVVDEESIQEAFYQIAYELFDNNVEELNALQLRYIARAQKIDDFISDPAGTMTEVKWVSPDKLGDFVKWGDTIPLIQSIVKEYLRRN